MYIGVTAEHRTMGGYRKYNYQLVVIRNGTITGGYLEAYCNGKRPDWSLANEERGSSERSVASDERGVATERQVERRGDIHSDSLCVRVCGCL